MAYQICFDLYESASQQFLSSVIQNLRTVGTPIPAVPGSTNTGTVPTPDKDRWAGEENKDRPIPRQNPLSWFMFTNAQGLFNANGSDLSLRKCLFRLSMRLRLTGKVTKNSTF